MARARNWALTIRFPAYIFDPTGSKSVRLWPGRDLGPPDSQARAISPRIQKSQPPAGGDAQKLCGAFGVQKQAAIDHILWTERCDFEIFRHEALCKTLGLPEFAAACGYGYITRGEVPVGLEAKYLVKVT